MSCPSIKPHPHLICIHLLFYHSPFTKHPAPMEETLLPKALRHEHYNSTVNNKTTKVPENPQETMEFLSRSWSVSALQVSKALSHQPPQPPPLPKTYSQPSKPHSTNFSTSVQSEGMIIGDMEEDPQLASLNPFSFASSATSQLVLERIMSVSQSSQEISPLTSGRLSHSSEPMNGGNGIQSGGSRNGSDSPPISPHDDLDDVVKSLRLNNTLQPQLSGGGRSGAGTCPSTPAGGKTVGRWLKERREKKKEENRTHNAQIHAAISVAGVAAAVAAIAAATAASSGSAKDDQTTKTDTAIASAATLVAAQCVETAEAMGAEREQLGSVVSSAVNVRSHDDIMTLTAAAATALRGAATLKARTMKEVWNIASAIPVEKGLGAVVDANTDHYNTKSSSSDEIGTGDNVFGICSLELLARGSELLKRTRKGDLHWKIVSVYIHRTGQVMLKMKSRHVGGTITKKKKNIVLEVHKDMPAWPGRPFMEGGEQPRYFGLKTQLRGIVEFECKNQREHDIWTQGVSRLLSVVAARKKRCRNNN